MKRILLGIFFSALFGMAQAGTLEISNSSNISFKGYDGQPQTVTGNESHGSWGSLVATSAGYFSATYLGQESGYTDGFSFGIGNGSLKEIYTIGTTISEFVSAGTLNFMFSDNAGLGHIFSNGQLQQNTLGFAIMDGQTNRYGKFDYILGFNDSYAGDADYDDFVVGVNFVSVAPVPEPQTYAMLLAGLGLLGLSARRRKDQTYD
jgi:PEP-CTERM motif